MRSAARAATASMLARNVCLGCSPCFQVAELLRDDFSQINAQAIHDPLSKIGMRRAAEDLNVGHSAAENYVGPLEVCSQQTLSTHWMR